MSVEQIKKHFGDMKISVDVYYGKEKGKLDLPKFNTEELARMMALEELIQNNKEKESLKEVVYLFKDKIIKDNPELEESSDAVEHFVMENLDRLIKASTKFAPDSLQRMMKIKQSIKK